MLNIVISRQPLWWKTKRKMIFLSFEKWCPIFSTSLYVLGQACPTFSVHAPKIFATQAFIGRCATHTFIACHCSQTCNIIFTLWSQKKAIVSGGYQKKKKKKKRSSPVLLHFYHHFWPKYVIQRRANQVGTCFFFFGRCHCSNKFFGQIQGHFLKLPKTSSTCNAPLQTMQCATFGHPCFRKCSIQKNDKPFEKIKKIKDLKDLEISDLQNQ